MARIPNDRDPFLVAQAGRMFRLLTAVASYPLGSPIKEELLKEIQALRSEAYLDGIDTIGVSEGCWDPPESALV